MVQALLDVLPDGRVLTDPDVLAAHSRDASTGTPAGRPAALVRARSTDDVVATLRVASALRLPVVPRGAGSGLAGGANAVDGGIVLSLAAMDRVLEVDVAGRTATAQAGTVTAALQDEVARHGLWYPPDPASRAWSTIGGNVATGAGGSCCLRHGTTRDWVSGLTAVLVDGTVVRTGGRTCKDVAGLDLTRLLVGSEGTLAVVTEVVVRLRPAQRPQATVVASFADLATAGAAIVALTAATEPSLLELLDRTTVRAVDDLTRMGLDRDAGALLLLQTEEPERVGALCAGATDVLVTDDRAEGQALLEARRQAYPALERLGRTLLDDVCVPVPQVPAMVAAVERVAAESGLVIGTFGHAGDGNLHPVVVYDDGQEAAALAAFGALLDAALALGGTVTGEHGVGRLKLPYLERQVGTAERALMRRVKAAFDPQGLLNPGAAL